MSVLIIDYGMGNLASVRRAFEECGASVFISNNPLEIKDAERLVLPGVGAFHDAMVLLSEKGWVNAIREAVLNEGIPVLGICLGMQLLANSGVEGGETHGLALVPGRVVRLEPKDVRERVPHVGWNEVHFATTHQLFDGIADGTDFYFVHSYHFIPDEPKYVLATTPYCESFVSVVANEKVFGTQFHPEKSSKVGFKLIQNFLRVK
ncbi:MAG: imidazole glycerol phosphate synthase subunit HisH [Dissulfuribacterales bacterium]